MRVAAKPVGDRGAGIKRPVMEPRNSALRAAKWNASVVLRNAISFIATAAFKTKIPLFHPPSQETPDVNLGRNAEPLRRMSPRALHPLNPVDREGGPS